MLFSSAEIADYINAGFEPVWVSVRPVPMVTIDFGNGHKLTRTLHGNIATSVCDVDGKVLDMLPGIYQPGEYRKQLEQFTLLHRFVRASVFGQNIAAQSRAYHQRQFEKLRAEQPTDVLVYSAVADIGKARVENPIKLLAAADATGILQRDPVTGQVRKGDASPPTVKKTDGVAGWKELAEDTQINETLRRKQIHEKLAATGPVPPAELVKWLYKEVLHADIDDPLLGLGEVLNKNYPFADEERAAVVP